MEGREIEVCLISLSVPYLLFLDTQIPITNCLGSAGERSAQQERESCSENGQGRQQRDPARVLRIKRTEALGSIQRVQERPGRDTTSEELCSA